MKAVSVGPGARHVTVTFVSRVTTPNSGREAEVGVHYLNST